MAFSVGVLLIVVRTNHYRVWIFGTLQCMKNRLPEWKMMTCIALLLNKLIPFLNHRYRPGSISDLVKRSVEYGLKKVLNKMITTNFLSCCLPVRTLYLPSRVQSTRWGCRRCSSMKIWDLSTSFLRITLKYAIGLQSTSGYPFLFSHG